MSHTTHCCQRHGCKYGIGSACPVETGILEQEYPCESCSGEEHIKIVGFHHWSGGDAVPAEIAGLIKFKFAYFLPMDVLRTLTKTYDVQLFHKTIELGNHKIDGLMLMLDRPGGRHR